MPSKYVEELKKTKEGKEALSKAHYKKEKYVITKWKGTKREIQENRVMLVRRLPKGTIINGKKVGGRFLGSIINTRKQKRIIEKTYASGIYRVGLDKDGKVITRKKIAGKETPEWQTAKHQFLKNANIFRCSLALNDIPYKGNDYYGFRIVAFSRQKTKLQQIYPQKMYERLIRFIEECLKYRRSNFDGWFEHTLNYMGKIPPELSNSSIKDSGKYELYWTKRSTGETKKYDWGKIENL